MTSALPRVAAIIPAYNAEKYLAEAIQSALQQTYAEMEVIVVNDGSSDATLSVAESFGARVTVIDQANKGVSAARNSAAKATDAPFLAFLDADDIWEADKIERQIEVFQRHPQLVLVSGCHRRIDERGRFLGDDQKCQHMGQVRNFWDDLLYGGPVEGMGLSTQMVRADVFHRESGFLENRKMISLDFELLIRLAVHGPFYIIDRPLTRYRLRPDSMIHSDRWREFNAQRVIMDMHVEHFSPWQYRRRRSGIYFQWADTLLHEGSSEGWSRLWQSISYNPLALPAYWLGLKNLLKIVVKPFRPARDS